MSRRQVIVVVLIAFFVGGVSGPIFNRYIIPTLSALPGLGFMQHWSSETPIIINRREQVVLDDGANILELAKQAQSFTVSIFSSDQNSPELLGAGIIVTSDGLILTSREVLGDAKDISVVLNDGRTFDGLVRALDRKSELAMVSISANNLNVAQFEDANNLQTGQRVLALGNSTVAFTRQFTSGVVTQRVNQAASLTKVFSTEVLNETFGFSDDLTEDFVGGPLFNLDGRVVGLVTTTQGKIVTSEGLNQSLAVYLNTGKIIRPYMGLRYYEYSGVLANLRGLPQAGSMISAVDDNSPADSAGLGSGDFITAVDNASLETASLERLINQRQSGPVRLKILRASQEQEITIDLPQR